MAFSSSRRFAFFAFPAELLLQRITQQCGRYRGPNSQRGGRGGAFSGWSHARGRTLEGWAASPRGGSLHLRTVIRDSLGISRPRQSVESRPPGRTDPPEPLGRSRQQAPGSNLLRNPSGPGVWLTPEKAEEAYPFSGCPSVL